MNKNLAARYLDPLDGYSASRQFVAEQTQTSLDDLHLLSVFENLPGSFKILKAVMEAGGLVNGSLKVSDHPQESLSLGYQWVVSGDLPEHCVEIPVYLNHTRQHLVSVFRIPAASETP